MIYYNRTQSEQLRAHNRTQTILLETANPL
jgi:hypothetical protein